MVDIQGLCTYNPKTHEYLIRIGKLVFPFKTANETFKYFLGRLTFGKLRHLLEAKNTNDFSFFLTDIYLSSYLTVLSLKQKPLFNPLYSFKIF